MASFNEVAEQYATEIREAATERYGTKSASVLESRDDARRRRIREALQKVGTRLDGLVYSKEDRHLSEEDKQRIVDLLAEKLGHQRPRRLRIALKEASVANFLAVLSDIEEILQRLEAG